MNKRQRQHGSGRQYLQILLSLKNLSTIGQLGLWSAFAGEEAERRAR